MISFSYSFLDRFYNVCPEQARRDFITKDYKKPFVQVEGGVDAHRVLEARLKEKTPLPAELASAEPIVRSFERYKVKTEVAFAVDRWIKPCGFWGQGGADGHAWLRGKFDVVAYPSEKEALIADWKTGKVREKQDQLELGAMLLMENEPAVDRVVSVNVWLKTGRPGTPYVFERSGKSPLWLKWIQKMRAVEALNPEAEWEKRPGPLCGWCPVRTCEHHRGR